MSEQLDRLREFAGIAWIIGDREGCIRLHAIIDAIESLSTRLDALEPIFGIEQNGTQPERRLNA